jgi:putative tryptophan/tyrosine transport system substrate-binding protein
MGMLPLKSGPQQMQFDGLNRREFITLLGGGAVARPLAARAQQSGAPRRVGVLLAGLTANDAVGQVRMAAFRQGLQSLGWTEGRNLSIDVRWPGADAERLRTFAAELAATRPDAIFAGNEAAALAFRQATSTLPIVFVQVADRVAVGLVESIARPGSNITGFALWEYGFAAKWAEVLREIAPRTVRIGVIYDPANAMQRQLPDLERALPPGVQAVALSVSSRSDLENAIERIAIEPNGALIVLPGPLAVAHRDLIIILAVKHRLPLIYSYPYYTAAGGLISYGPDPVDQYQQAAGYVDRILKGEKPADLPVQFPTKYILAINLKTAKALGLTVPDTLLARADEVIE